MNQFEGTPLATRTAPTLGPRLRSGCNLLEARQSRVGALLSRHRLHWTRGWVPVAGFRWATSYRDTGAALKARRKQPDINACTVHSWRGYGGNLREEVGRGWDWGPAPGERRKEKGKWMKEPSGRLQLSHVDNEKTTSESETDSDSDDEAGGSVTQRLERRAEHDCL